MHVKQSLAAILSGRGRKNLFWLSWLGDARTSLRKEDHSRFAQAEMLQHERAFKVDGSEGAMFAYFRTAAVRQAI